MSFEYTEKNLMKVRVRPDGTLNGDDLSDASHRIVREQCSLLHYHLQEFCDTINIIDARYFDKIKHDVWGLQRSIGTRKLETESESS